MGIEGLGLEHRGHYKRSTESHGGPASILNAPTSPVSRPPLESCLVAHRIESAKPALGLDREKGQEGPLSYQAGLRMKRWVSTRAGRTQGPQRPAQDSRIAMPLCGLDSQRVAAAPRQGSECPCRAERIFAIPDVRDRGRWMKIPEVRDSGRWMKATSGLVYPGQFPGIIIIMHTHTCHVTLEAVQTLVEQERPWGGVIAARWVNFPGG